MAERRSCGAGGGLALALALGAAGCGAEPAPAPACGGEPCQGETLVVETQNATRSADVNCCPVDGGFSNYTWSGAWSSWTAWEPAGAACNEEQTRLRFRQRARACDSGRRPAR